MKKLLFFSISMILFIINAQAQWYPSKGLYSEFVRCLKVSGDTLFAGAAPEIYISTDYGDNWELIGSSPFPNDRFYSILIDGNHIYAGSMELLMISPDRGQTWTTHSDYKTVTSLIMAGDTLVMSANKKVYFSTDQGNSFVYGGLQHSSDLRDLAYLNGVFYAGTNYGLYRSYDRGISWSRFNNIPTVYNSSDILTLTTQNGSLYAGGIQRLFMTQDNGQTWDVIADLNYSPIAAVIVNNEEIYITFYSQTFYSTDHGANWIDISQYGFQCLAKQDNYVFAGWTDCLFRSDPQTEHIFTKIGEGMKTPTISELYEKNGKLYCLATGETPGTLAPEENFFIATSTDGVSWIHKNTLSSYRSDGFYHSKSDTIYYGYGVNKVAKQPLDSGFFKTYNSPANVCCFAFSGDTVFCGSSQGVHFSADYCQSWTRCNDGIWSYDITDLLMVNDTLYASTRDQGVFRSTNRGASWSEARQGIINMNVNKLKFLQGKIYAFTDTGLSFSANGGVSWNNLNSGIESIKVNDLIIHSDALLIATDDGLYISHNDGASWMQWNSGIEGMETLCLYATEDKILCGTKDHSVWYRPPSSLGTSEIPHVEFGFNVYPNPVAADFTINYFLPEAGRISISLSDIQGKKIQILKDDKLQAAGSYNDSFLLSNTISPGLYLLEIKTKDYIKSIRIIKQ